MFAFWSFFVNKSRFTYLILIALIVFGVGSVFAIPKESAPEVQIPIAIVTTFFPGSSAEDVEQLITNKIEEQLNNNLDDISNLTSTSREGLSTVVVEFSAQADIQKSIQEVKDEVSKVENELPNEAEDPIVSDVNFADQPVLLISIASELPVSQLIVLTDDVIDEIKKVKGVSRIQKDGIPEKEVQVIVKKAALSKFGLTLPDIVQAISLSNNSLPVGSIKFEGIEYAIKFKGDIENASEVRNVAITSVGGRPVYIRDVAFVSDGVSAQNTLARVSIDGSFSEQAVSLSVFKKRGGDVTRLSNDIRSKIDELQQPGNILTDAKVLISFDVGEFVKDDLKSLSLTALQTILLVMIILFLALGLREALIAGLAIPLSFLVGFIGLNASGNTINFVSLFSLILAVGILVDSAIVVTEAIHKKLEEGLSKNEAALATIKEFHLPLTSGTATTIAVFAPLFLISGIVGEFVASIPFTIIFVLLASLFVALGFLPTIGSQFIKAKEDTRLSHLRDLYTKRFTFWYKKKLESILGNRKREKKFIWFMGLLFLVSFALPVSGIVKTIFFPPQDSEFVFIEIEKPIGTDILVTDLAVRQVEEVLYEDRRVESFVTTVGSASSFGDGLTGSQLGNITAILKNKRSEKSLKIVEDLRREFSQIKSASISVFQDSGGPPVGAPVLIRFFGDNLDVLAAVAGQSEDILKSISGTAEVDSSARSDATEFVLTVNRAKLTEFGLNPTAIAQALRTAVVGVTATTIRTPESDIDVEVKLDLNTNFLDAHDTNRTTIDSIRNLEIQTPKGTVLLGSLVETTVARSNTTIRHEDRKRIVSVTSEIGSEGNVGEIVKEFTERIEEIGLPDGVEISVGGESEDVDQSFKDMFISLIVGMIAVIAILVLQFNSYRYALFIIVAVPLSLIGIFFGLAITGLPVSFPSILGFIALSGIVVNNSIILIDVMNNLRRDNPLMSSREIVIEGAALRIRPILLTTLTTVIGIIPLTYASELWSPLAYSIMFGLAFATVITLFLVPILYDRWPRKGTTNTEVNDNPKPYPQKELKSTIELPDMFENIDISREMQEDR